MNIEYDSYEEIAYYKNTEYLAQLFDFAIHNNGNGESILNNSGLSSLSEKYQDVLTPYSFNGPYQNDNIRYNPKKVFLSIYNSLKEDYKLLFIKNIIENLNTYKIDIEELKNNLSIAGYSLLTGYNTFSGYSIKQTTKGFIERKEDINLLESTIKEKYQDNYKIYQEILSTFYNGEYKSCIDNCRTLFDNITKEITNLSTDKAVLKLTNEIIVEDGNVIENKDKIYQYWIKNRKGANRYRYFTTLYSVMSGLGTHNEDTPTRKDTILIMRALEDVLVWILDLN